MSEGLPHPVTGQPFDSPVPPGTGWPGDPATPDTPVARSRSGVRRLARTDDIGVLEARISVCAACPRLVRWREDVAHTKRASFADQPYWGRPVPGWGDEHPEILVVGLAPAANGANRTGRNFTGDSSGDWLFASLHRTGLAALPTSQSAADGQRLIGARLVATVRCAPPDNKPTVVERDNCEPWLTREVQLVADSLRVVVALGSYGWSAALRALRDAGYVLPRPRPKFGHGVEAVLDHPGLPPLTVVASYHPSQHNTFTGRLTAEMMDTIFTRARTIAAG